MNNTEDNNNNEQTIFGNSNTIGPSDFGKLGRNIQIMIGTYVYRAHKKKNSTRGLKLVGVDSLGSHQSVFVFLIPVLLMHAWVIGLVLGRLAGVGYKNFSSNPLSE